VGGEFVDHGISGGASLEKRDALMDAFNCLEAGDVLVIAKRCRLARDTMSAVVIERMVSKRGARIESADGAGNGDGPEAILMRRMLDAFAEYERAMIRARTRAALRAKKDRGQRAGNVPFGYSATESGELVKNDQEQQIISQILRLRSSGMSIRKITEAIEREGVVGRAGRPLGKSQVHNITKAA
jgi:DNA invertase Pin-like site-specific DNA recombinase